MIEHVIFTPEADDDVAGSYDWYERQEPGLGEDFLRSVEACVRGIQRHPEMYPAAIDEFRRAPIRRFHLDFLRVDCRWHYYLLCISLLTRSTKVAQASRLLNTRA